MPTDEEWEGMGRRVDMKLNTPEKLPDTAYYGYLRGWEACKKAVLEWLRNEDIEHDPDDVYTGRAHRVAAVEKLRKP